MAECKHEGNTIPVVCHYCHGILPSYSALRAEADRVTKERDEAQANRERWQKAFYESDEKSLALMRERDAARADRDRAQARAEQLFEQCDAFFMAWDRATKDREDMRLRLASIFQIASPRPTRDRSAGIAEEVQRVADRLGIEVKLEKPTKEGR